MSKGSPIPQIYVRDWPNRSLKIKEIDRWESSEAKNPVSNVDFDEVYHFWSLLPENYKHFIIGKRSHNSDCKPKYNEVILKSKNKFKVFVDENLGIAPRKLAGHF